MANPNKTIGLLTIMVCWPCIAFAAADPYPVAWTRQMGTSGAEEACAVAVDAAGAVYVSGWSNGALFPGRVGGTDPFVAKYDTHGNLLWGRQWGSSNVDRGYGMAVGMTGVYITGYTDGAMAGSSAGGADMFLSKFDLSGNFQWTKQIGSSQVDRGYGVHVDAAENIFVAGATDGALDGAGVAGGGDAFLMKFDASGNRQWTRQLGTPAQESCQAVTTDASGNTYITGMTMGNLDGINRGQKDAYVAKYDVSGTLQWVRQRGTTNWDISWDVVADGNKIYTAGYWGCCDPSLTRYDDAGNMVWARVQSGNNSTDFFNSVAADGAGGILATGRTYGSLGGPNMGGADMFFQKFDEAGNLLWSQHLGTAGDDEGISIAADGTGPVYITGYVGGNVGGTYAGFSDIYLIKYAPETSAGMTALSLTLLMLRRRSRRSSVS